MGTEEMDEDDEFGQEDEEDDDLNLDVLIKDDYVSSSDVPSESDDVEILDPIDPKSTDLASNDSTSSSTINPSKRRRVRVLSDDSMADAASTLSLSETIPDNSDQVENSNQEPTSDFIQPRIQEETNQEPITHQSQPGTNKVSGRGRQRAKIHTVVGEAELINSIQNPNEPVRRVYNLRNKK